MKLFVCKRKSKKGHEYVGLFLTTADDREYLLSFDRITICNVIQCSPDMLNELKLDEIVEVK